MVSAWNAEHKEEIALLERTRKITSRYFLLPSVCLRDETCSTALNDLLMLPFGHGSPILVRLQCFERRMEIHRPLLLMLRPVLFSLCSSVCVSQIHQASHRISSFILSSPLRAVLELDGCLKQAYNCTVQRGPSLGFHLSSLPDGSGAVPVEAKQYVCQVRRLMVVQSLRFGLAVNFLFSNISCNSPM